jgi:cytochrome c553
MKASVLSLGMAVATAALLAAACGDPDSGLAGRGNRVPGAEDESPGNGDTRGEKSPNATYEDPRDPETEVLPNMLEGLATGDAQMQILCSRGQLDAVTNAFCKEKKTVASMTEVLEAIGLGFKDRTANGDNGVNGNPQFALSGNSSSLVAREVSAINPRAFIMPPTPGQPQRIPGYVIATFVRGERFIEIAAEDPNSKKLTLYLLKFKIPCDANKSCKFGDVLTPAVEKGWTGFDVYDDEDLKNTLADCRHCHQPGGPSSKLMLRMQELKDPWTHWFRNDRPGGVALIKDYLNAHGEKEDYAGIPAAIIQKADGRAMEDFVIGQGFGTQPNVFDSKRIEDEIRLSASLQPEVNTPEGNSATWQQLYDAAARGEFIPPPYHDVKVTDPDKLAFAGGSYRLMTEGELPRAELPDIRRVFLESALVDMTMRTKPGFSGKEVLVQACAQCHNPSLDQSITRAKFDVTKLDSMSPADKQATIARLKLPGSDRLHMPPAIMRTLSDDALNSAIQYLSQ